MTFSDRHGKIRRVPNQPKTPVHGCRVPDDLWHEAQRLALAEGKTISEVVRECLVRYVRQQRRKLRRQGEK